MEIVFALSQNNSDSSAKRNKGKSLIAFPENYTVIDIETTGHCADYDDIIEVAAVRVRNNKVSDTFQSLVKPSLPIDEFISELTGITNEMLESAPDASAVLPAFKEFISDDILVGHNVNFDINFLYDFLLGIADTELNNDYIDTYRLSRKLLPDLKRHRLSDIVCALSISAKNHHRSLPDCEMTNECFKKLHEIALSKYSDISTFCSSFVYRMTDISKLTPESENFETTHPLYGSVCVFTGKLEKMNRESAAQLVVNLGGKCANSVTKATNFLILGNADYCSNVKNRKTEKMLKAEKYKLAGQNIEIIPETVFYDML